MVLKVFGKACHPRGKVKITWRPLPSSEEERTGTTRTGSIKECHKEDKDQLFSLVNEGGTSIIGLRRKGSFRLNIQQGCTRPVQQRGKLPEAVV